MDVEELLRKLEPLRPEQTKHWRRARATASPDVRSLIDRAITETAFEILGDPHLPLFSLPPVGKARGRIELGPILYVKPRHSMGLRVPELLAHCALFGRSGSGKTNATFVLLQQLATAGVSILFWDFKRTARHWLHATGLTGKVFTPGRQLAPLPFNIFSSPPGMEREVFWELALDTIGSAYTLGEGARSMLRKALHQQGDPPTAESLLDSLKQLETNERSRGWKTSAIRALESINTSQLSTSDTSAESLLEGLTVIELEALSASARKCLLPLLCLYLYYMGLAHPEREKLRLIVVIEEAHNVLGANPHRGRETVLEMLLRQAREIGMGFIVVTQEPSQISSSVLANIHTSIVFNLKSPADRRKAAGLSGLAERDERLFADLPIGEAVVRLQSRWTQPVRVRFPLVHIEKGSASDTAVAHLNQAATTRSGTRGPFPRQSSHVRRVLNDEGPLDTRSLRLLADIVAFPDDGVRSRYGRLRLSSYSGTKLQRELVSAGWLKRIEVPSGPSRKMVLALTRRAREALRLGSVAGGTVHGYWQGYYARHFERDGWSVRLEAPRKGGFVDVLAVRGTETMGIEVETGRSDAVSNARNALRSRFGRLLVVATTPDAFSAVESELATAGLLILGRVSLVLAPAIE